MQTGFFKRLSLAALLLCGTAAAQQQYVASTIAGTPVVSGYDGDFGPALSAKFSGPIAVAPDNKGSYYIADYGNKLIRKVSANGIVTPFAGTGVLGFSGDGGPARSAQFSVIHGLAVDAAGRVYISDSSNARIRVIDLNGNISTFAGTGVRGYSGNGGQAINARLAYPAGLAFDPAGNLYVADVGNGSVRKISPSGQIDAFAGTGFAGFGAVVGDGGPAFSAVLALPYSVAADGLGNVYIGDVGSSSIARVGTDGILRTVLFGAATGSIAADAAGNVFFTNYRTHTIGRISPGGAIDTIGGTSAAGFDGDGSPSQFAPFNQPYGVSADSTGKLYVADYANQVVRLLTPIATSAVFVTNGASNIGIVGGNAVAVAPGEIVTLFGAGLGDTATGQPNASGALPTRLGNTTVSVNGVPAPIVATTPGTVAVIVPSSTSGDQAQFTVAVGGKTVATAASRIFGAAPGIFTAVSGGNNTLAIRNDDGTVNTSDNAAAQASVITIFITGAGAYSPSLPDGQVATAATDVRTTFPITVLINDESSSVAFVRTVPGQPGSVLQIGARIPADVKSSSGYAVQVKVEKLGSQATTIAVQ